MSRFHYWQFLINVEGQPIPDANISVYLAGTDSPATIYFDEFGSSHSGVAPQVITNNMGYFEFWVGDAAEEFGYAKGQKFKLEWEKPGVALGEIDWIDVFPQVIEVDETDSISTAKNKVISNKLAFRWEEHRIHTVQDQGFPVHGIEAVNEYDSDAFPNKLISNFLAKKWDEHSNHLLPSESPHGLVPVNSTLTDNVFNKLVSNKVIHDIGTSMVTIQDNLDLINDKIVEMGNAGNIFLPHGLSSTWVLTHNFGVKYVSVTIYGLDDKEVKAKDVDLTNLNVVTVTFDQPVQGYAVITGNVVEGGNDVPPFVIEGDHGSLTGLLGDDHTQYALINGTRAFTGPISGVMPIDPDNLTTKEYVDYEIYNIVIQHSRISNASIGDDHLQYMPIEATRPFRQPVGGKDPIDEYDLTTKRYVDSHIFSHHTLIDTDFDDHLQYIHKDGRRAFTHVISGVIPVQPSHLATKEYVDLHGVRKYDESIVSWDGTSPSYFKVITHNLNEMYPIITIWNTATNMVGFVTSIESLDNNSFKIITTTTDELLIKVRT